MLETLPPVIFQIVGKSTTYNTLVARGFPCNYTASPDTTTATSTAPPSAVVSAPKGSTITLVVSRGSKFVFIPNVYSIETSKAMATLKDLGLKVKVRSIGKKTVKYVTNVSPKIGAKVLRGTVVTITVG